MSFVLPNTNLDEDLRRDASIGERLETISISPADVERARRLKALEIEFIPGEWIEDYELPNQISLEVDDRLKPEKESELFRAMNLLKFRADRLRNQLSTSSPSLAVLDEIDGLLATAQRIRNYLVRVFMRLVPAVAKRLANPQFPLDDLSSDGYATLLRAVEIFDVERGNRFSTYATHAIRRNLFRHIMKGRTQQQRIASAENLDKVMDDRKWTWEFQQRMESAVSHVNDCIEQLSPRDRTIVQARFGLGDWPGPCTLQNLADQLGISRERVRQLEARALSRLGKMASAMVPEFD